MKTITSYMITKLYTWTVRDLNLIYDNCFTYSYENCCDDGPSNTYALTLAALIDTWGSIMRDKFGDLDHEDKAIKKNVEHILDLLYKRDPDNYQIFDVSSNRIRKDIVEIFRHNLIHNLGKKPKGNEFDLNIDTKGPGINQQIENERWHINCKKLKEDFLNILRIELPNLIKEENFPRF